MTAEILLENLLINNVQVSVVDGNLKVISPNRKLLPEIKVQLKNHKAEIIQLISSEEKQEVTWFDLCAVCKSPLYEQRNQWHCPTIGCFESRVKGDL